jgi:hypothetical protein
MPVRRTAQPTPTPSSPFVKAICVDPTPFRGSQTDPILDQFPSQKGSFLKQPDAVIPEATRRLFATQRARTRRRLPHRENAEGHKLQSIVLVLLKEAASLRLLQLERCGRLVWMLELLLSENPAVLCASAWLPRWSVRTVRTARVGPGCSPSDQARPCRRWLPP